MITNWMKFENFFNTPFQMESPVSVKSNRLVMMNELCHYDKETINIPNFTFFLS